ncbi:N-acetylglucosamine kinase [Cryobacterium sp. MDB1-18-2]|uniref:N-acetylglucosamine kinase n=1 Tax=unclassified Cryobacterium TaxID=2649013 RepID=UPI001068D945|nr:MULTISPECIES: BadF/BadG/BcrA/BcrD ATPase family protein [unclassified Cryobacterium]MEB0004283.1 BadF/BadG/BcrA/BcrD ATPase family protein [Cryobacterium sp. RTC2.1]TFC32610.1 N-acetylglucosamine kinase [Cryobacterium sp. MDB1-18-2]TFC39830.1 N-acetylglucosamine kinase [Cryobacterium sp. MDB1-18-1]
MSFFLGVDGGGSKTAFVLLNDSGDIVAETQTPSCYYFSEGIELVGRILAQGIGTIAAQAGLETKDIDQAFFGLPGYGEVSSDIERLNAVPRAVLGHDRYTCDNDMVCGWAGSLGAVDGINVISGTGSMTYGERAGHGHRVGGWSELFGDEGSAYWIAIRGLNAFTRMSDGRLPRGPLYDVVKARADVNSDLDLIDVVVNQWKGQRGAIADLSKTVVEAAAQGDLIAAQILTDACAELARIVDTTRTELGFGDDDTVPVSYSGGMFTAAAVRSGFEEALSALPPKYELRTPLFGPAVGAALYAAKKAGTPLSEAALAQLRSH